MPFSSDRIGACSPWTAVRAIFQMRLPAGSRRQLFLAIMLSSACYGNRDARLGIADLAKLTGLAPRTIKTAVAALINAGLVVRVKRCRYLRVTLPVREDDDDNRHENHQQHQRVDQKRDRTSGIFTVRQLETILGVLADVSALSGADAGSLTLPATVAGRLGLAVGTTYAEAVELIGRSGTRKQAHVLTGAILGLRRDERVQGKDLP